jgi:hypothetical protein
MLAAQIYSRQADFFIIREGKTELELSLRIRGDGGPHGLRRVAGEFLNEMLNQDLRLSVAKANRGLMHLSLAQTLRCAAGERPAVTLGRKAQQQLRREASRLKAKAMRGGI